MFVSMFALSTHQHPPDYIHLKGEMVSEHTVSLPLKEATIAVGQQTTKTFSLLNFLPLRFILRFHSDKSQYTP